VAIYLGIDGGGSKTTCAIGDESSLLGTGTAGGSNVIRVGEAQAREAFQAAIRQACAVANVAASDVKKACVGVAGAARAEISELVRRLVAEIVPCEIEVVGDMVIALEAAFGAGPGVVTVAGTGSIAYGRDAKGQTARAGGWGFAVSDEGSGHWIGRSAVAASLRAHDERESTQLLSSIMKAWRLNSLDEVVLAANGSPLPDFAALLPTVLAAADAGDALARSVLTQAAAELASLAKIVVERLFAEAPTIPVAMSGGVFRSSALVRQVFYNSLRSEYPHAAVNATVIEPVRGALELARKGSGS
jgi:N-acetylglucosamine kinase-like BadF-type ATPase